VAWIDSFAKFSMFKGTLLETKNINKEIGGNFWPTLIKGFSTSTAQGNFTAQTYSTGDWKVFFKNLQPNSIGICNPSNSASPDLILKIQEIKTSEPILLGIAVKNLHSTGSTNWQTIQDEIKKFLDRVNKQLPNVEVLLVIASTQLIKEIADVIGNKEKEVYIAGKYFYNKVCNSHLYQ
jgi:hypothetical protein